MMEQFLPRTIRELEQGPKPKVAGSVKLPPGISILELITSTDATTNDGRLLCEFLAPPSAIEKVRESGVPMELTPSKSEGTRYGEMMNYSAMEEVVKNWDAITGGLAWIHQQYFGAIIPDRVTARELKEMAAIGLSLPTYLLYRAEKPYRKYNHIPAVVGGIFKVSQGLHTVAGAISDSDENMVMTPKIVYETAEEKGLLLDGRACPAPKAMILSMSEAILNPGNPTKSLEAIIPNFESLKFYAEMYAYIFVEGIRTQRYGKRLLGQIGASKTLPERLKLIQDFGEMEQSFLFVAGPYQEATNYGLGRNPNTPDPPTRQDLDPLWEGYGIEFVRLIQMALGL